jgi:uncharacterized protein
MKFTQQRQEGVNLIRRYGADFIVIGEQELRSSCIVDPHSIAAWAPRSVEELGLEDLPALFDRSPEVVVLATGATQKFPRAALRAEFAARRIGLEVMEIGAAARTYNVLVSEDRRALAAVLFPGPAKRPE